MPGHTTRTRFQTGAGVLYTVYVTDGSGYFEDYPEFAENVLTFGFGAKLDHGSGLFDDNVRITITDFVMRFLTGNPAKILFFICDVADQRQRSRMKTFERWYRLANNALIEKHDETIRGGEVNFYGSLLFLKSNPMKQQVINAFIRFRTELENKLKD